MIDLKPACDTMIGLLVGTANDQLTNPTPCSEYSVALLIDHVDVVARGFVALARKELDATPEPVEGPDPRRNIAERLSELGTVWDDPAVWQGSTAAPDGPDLANEVWGKIVLTELVVHGWDLARATGQSFALPDETLRACLEHVAVFVPNAPVPELWGPAVEVSGESLIDRIVGITGRDPHWSAATVRS
ncbi:TIGR03086 family metal-binding protein [Nocardia sp. NPDC049149]|uniref:TIGR03086 family metal-binding protein n=1 Tax=Nocardia sp. NPDC049149 TaxID=3364315 RepID=UPI0037212BE4